ncbi:Hypothetical protein CAP_2974 [Chondromyces apiculatus DSM 436]|uniref:Uncharacterized protein n=1 Tax=Chondromyces apiculatus DSM 436 TaxID=1192034 RepID=A0A017T8X2_9BACT|nr:Hypothetical protein CAP_2974 [Chondromyces apiculatus DSM 436]
MSTEGSWGERSRNLAGLPWCVNDHPTGVRTDVRLSWRGGARRVTCETRRRPGAAQAGALALALMGCSSQASTREGVPVTVVSIAPLPAPAEPSSQQAPAAPAKPPERFTLAAEGRFVQLLPFDGGALLVGLPGDAQAVVGLVGPRAGHRPRGGHAHRARRAGGRDRGRARGGVSRRGPADEPPVRQVGAGRCRRRAPLRGRPLGEGARRAAPRAGAGRGALRRGRAPRRAARQARPGGALATLGSTPYQPALAPPGGGATGPGSSRATCTSRLLPTSARVGPRIACGPPAMGRPVTPSSAHGDGRIRRPSLAPDTVSSSR